MTGRLEGRRALVTGASRGIGAAIARRLAADGARVIVHYGASRDAAEALAAGIGGVAVQADLARPDGPAALAASVEGPLDILVHNAGVAVFEAWGGFTTDGFDRMVAVNLRAPLFLTQALAPKLAEHGSVIFISSLVAQRSSQGGMFAAYAATKGGVEAVSLHVAGALAARNIRVNCIAPGAVETDMAGFLRSEEGRAITMATQAFKRIAQPDDIAGAVAWLASDDARWVTGQTISVNGGTRI
jgi:3-oxoacyl-[acyl-carrier protein] reductase